MELLYSMRRKPLKCEPPLLSELAMSHPLCAISIGNVIAFSSHASLSDSVGDMCGGFVYVADLDSPWDYHLVASLNDPVSALEWDCEGKQLVVGTTTGDVCVYGMKDFLLNQWICLYTANFPCEPIVKCIAFHHGRRLVQTAGDKKAEGLISERIQALPLAPTMRGHGGVSVEGCLSLTACGTLIAMTPVTGGTGAGSGADVTATGVTAAGRAHTVTASLRPRRERVTAAAMAHRKDGSVAVAAVCSHSSGAWRVVAAAATATAAAGRPPGAPPLLRPPALAVRALPALTGSASASGTGSSVGLPLAAAPASVSWGRDEDSLWVSLGGALQLYRLHQSAPKLHPMLAKGSAAASGQQASQKSDCFFTLAWQRIGSWPLEPQPQPQAGSVGSVGSAGSAGSAAALCGARGGALLCAGGRLALYHPKGGLLCSVNILEPEGTAPAAKRTKHSPSLALSHCCISYLGGVAVAVSRRSELHVCRMPQPQPQPQPHDTPTGGLSPAVTSLELAVLSGADCTDLVVGLSPAQALCEHDRMVEIFSRQPPHFQQYYFHAWLRLRIALLRVVGTPASWVSVSNLSALSALHAAWAAVCSAARADDAALTALEDHATHHHDKSAPPQEGKPEPWPGGPAPPPGRPGPGPGPGPLRRALDSALTAVAAVAAHAHTPSHTYSYALWSDPSALSLLRRLLAVGGPQGPQGPPGPQGPQGPQPQGPSPAAAVSRVLARLSPAAAAPLPAPHKQDLIEECSVLAATHGARVWECYPRMAVSAPHNQTPPLLLQYGVEPPSLRVSPQAPPFAATDRPHRLDHINYMYLGECAARWRQCSRCGAHALPEPAGSGCGSGAASASVSLRLPALKAVTHRFLHACRCGGKWTLVSNV